MAPLQIAHILTGVVLFVIGVVALLSGKAPDGSKRPNAPPASKLGPSGAADAPRAVSEVNRGIPTHTE